MRRNSGSPPTMSASTLPASSSEAARSPSGSSNGVAYLMRKNNIAVITGTARLQGEGRIAVTGRRRGAARHRGQAHHRRHRRARAELARARARRQADLDLQAKRWCRRASPQSLLIVGSGAIGIEFASFYRSLGAEVTVVEMLPRILPAEDAEISNFAKKRSRARGIAIHTDTRVERLVKERRQRDGASL